jgi:Zn-dependent protease
MYSFYDLQEKIKSNFRFSGQEVKAILITILAAAFILTFRSWGDKTFNFNAGMINLFNAFLIVALSLIVKVSVQKIYALHIGYKFEYRLWFYGILAAIFLTFVSNGYLAVLALGGFIIEMMPGHRLGYFRYGINYYSIGVIALMGPLSSIALALFFRMFSFMNNPLVELAIKFNVLIAFFSMLPLPPLDGGKVLYGARPLYAFGMAGITAAGILILMAKSIPMIIFGALFIAVLGWAVYFFGYEFKVQTRK